MKSNFRTSGYLVISAAISIALHVALWVFSDRLPIGLFAKADANANRPINVQTVDIRDRVKPRERIRQQEDMTRAELAETIRKESDSIKKIFEDQHLIDKPKPKLKLKDLSQSLKNPDPTQTVAPQIAMAPRPTIVSIDADTLKSDRLASENRPTSVPKLPRQNVDAARLPSLLTGDRLQRASGATINVGMLLSRPGIGSFRPGEMPQAPSFDDLQEPDERVKREGFVPFTALPSLPSETAGYTGGRSDIEVLDSLLSVTMHTFPDKDGGGFFRVDVRPNPRSDKLTAIPKDVMFLIDSSTSISNKKLEHFKASTLEALAYLNRNDRFNVVTFRENPEKLFQAYQPVSDESLEQARTYLKRLQRGGMTDVYAGLAPFVGEQQAQSDRPLNIFLMTDGQSTVKEALDNETMIRQIVAQNKDNVSIYTFSAGEKANRFLLDFLAYTNRGVSLHQHDLVDFRDQLVGFISGHSELIVSNLRYQITGGMGDSIYPRRLPHLYRGETLSVYGQYPAGAKEVAIQIIGLDATGRLEELVFRRGLGEASAADAGLALDWAAQKIFHLIAQRTLGSTHQLNDEIRRLAQKYNLYVPYL